MVTILKANALADLKADTPAEGGTPVSSEDSGG